MALAPGTPAPDFALASSEGGTVSLAALRGQKVVVFFYPKDNTPGCTQEACDFRDNFARIAAAGAAVYGVSKDTLASHGKFKAKYTLPFPLLSDPDNAVATAFGAYGDKVMYGKKVRGTIRSTFLIDATGRVAAAWSPVKVAGHVDAVLAALRGAAPAAPSAPEKKRA